MITTDSNVLFDGVLYNDIEIDLLLRTYGAEQSILKKENDDNNFTKSNSVLKFMFWFKSKEIVSKVFIIL